MSDFLGKGTGFPFAVENNKLRMSSEEDLIKESINIILSTEKGERVMEPDFGAGLQALAFSENNISTATLLSDQIKESLEKWEPRIEVIDVTVDSDEEQGNMLYINIAYRILSSNSKENLVFPFYLQGAS